MTLEGIIEAAGQRSFGPVLLVTGLSLPPKQTRGRSDRCYSRLASWHASSRIGRSVAVLGI